MEFFRRPVEGGGTVTHLNLAIVFGFIAVAFFSAAQALVVFRFLPAFHEQLIMSMWPWGVFLIGCAGLALFAAGRAYLPAPTSERLVRFVLYAFSIMTFAAFILLGLTRSIAESQPNWALGYLVASRYLVLGNFALFGIFVAVSVLVMRKTGTLSVALSIALFLTAVAANEQYGRRAYPDLESRFAISHGKAWRAITSMAQQCRSAHLPVPDFSMAELAEFPWSLHYYESVLRSSLGLGQQEKIEFVDWKALDSAARENYRRTAKSLDEVRRTLRVPEN
jgi:hypothetical protein